MIVIFTSSGWHEKVWNELQKMWVYSFWNDENDRHWGKIGINMKATSSKNYFQVSELDDINNELADGNVGIDDIENRWDENPYFV